MGVALTNCTAPAAQLLPLCGTMKMELGVGIHGRTRPAARSADVRLCVANSPSSATSARRAARASRGGTASAAHQRWNCISCNAANGTAAPRPLAPGWQLRGPLARHGGCSITMTCLDDDSLTAAVERSGPHRRPALGHVQFGATTTYAALVLQLNTNRASSRGEPTHPSWVGQLAVTWLSKRGTVQQLAHRAMPAISLAHGRAKSTRSAAQNLPAFPPRRRLGRALADGGGGSRASSISYLGPTCRQMGTACEEHPSL